MIEKYPYINILNEEIKINAPIFRKVIDKQYKLFGEPWAVKFNLRLEEYEKIMPFSLKLPVLAYGQFSLEAMRLQAEFDITKSYSTSDNYQEALDNVYLNHSYMSEVYLPALYLTHFLWPHHYEFSLWVKKEFFQKLSKLEDIRFCDIGLGTGFYSREILENFKNSTGVGFDISVSSINHAKKLFDAIFASERYIFKKEFLEPKITNSFNSFICIELLEHLDEPIIFLEKLYNSVEAGAVGVISAAVNAPNRDHIFLYQNNNEVRAQLKNAGFKILVEAKFNAYESGTFTDIVPSTAAFIVEKE